MSKAFRDLNNYEKEDVQLNFHTNMLRAIRPDLVHMRNINVGDLFTRVSKAGKLYQQTKTTDADSVSFNANAKIVAHGELTHLKSTSYRQADEIIYAFDKFIEKKIDALADNFVEYYVQFGGQMFPDLIDALHQRRTKYFYCERTVDKLTNADIRKYDTFLSSIYNTLLEHVADELEYTPYSSAADAELDFWEELALDIFPLAA